MHSEGFEPPTLGSEDRCSNRLSNYCKQGFGVLETCVVPITVPCDRVQGVCAVISNGSLASLAASWANLPIGIREAILILAASVSRSSAPMAAMNETDFESSPRRGH
jgi:hypothetical protein